MPGLERRVIRYPFGGWLFWIITVFPWLRAGKIGPNLMAGDSFNLAGGMLDLIFVAIGATFLVGRFTQTAVELSSQTLSVRIVPFMRPQTVRFSEIAKINWFSGSTLGFKHSSKGDVSISLMMIAKSKRKALVESIESVFESSSAT